MALKKIIATADIQELYSQCYVSIQSYRNLEQRGFENNRNMKETSDNRTSFGEKETYAGRPWFSTHAMP